MLKNYLLRKFYGWKSHKTFEVFDDSDIFNNWARHMIIPRMAVKHLKVDISLNDMNYLFNKIGK